MSEYYPEYQHTNSKRQIHWGSEIAANPPSVHYDEIMTTWREVHEWTEKEIMASDRGVGKWTEKIVRLPLYILPFLTTCSVSTGFAT